MAEPEQPKTPANPADLVPPRVQTWVQAVGQSPWLNGALGALLLLVVSVGAAYLVTPGLSGPGVPYDASAVGQVSHVTLKADRDYDILDEATTQKQREEAASSVRPVYDYDLSVAQGALSRVRTAFSRMQEAISAARAKLPPPEAAPAPPPVKRKGEAASPEPSPSDAPWLQRAVESERNDFFRELQVQLDDDDFRALAASQFSGELEQAVETVLKSSQDRAIGTASDELAALGSRGVTVRIFPSPSPSEAEAVLVGPGQPRLLGEPPLGHGPESVIDVPDLDRVRASLDAAEARLSPDLPLVARRAVVHVVKRILRPNLTYKPAETRLRQDLARLSVKPVILQLKKGDVVIRTGEHIDQRHALVFRGMRAQTAETDPRQVRTGSGLIAALLMVVLFGYGRSLRRFKPMRKDLLLLSAMLLGMLGLVDGSLWLGDVLRDRWVGLSGDVVAYAVPFAAGAMMVRFVLGAEETLLFSAVFAMLAAFVAGNSLTLGLYALVGSLVAAQRVAGARDRSALFRAGLWTGLCNAVCAASIQLISGRLMTMETGQAALAGLLGGGLLAPMLTMAVTPLIEWVFGYVTDIKLLELANLNHPALKELIVQAPGTYHHSIIMGSLVESAAQAIGANPLLARVCAYYHDIGKGKNPLYFAENQRGENKHDKLAPQMSAMIIKRHVTDGLEMARLYKLPKLVSDAIPQHHGTKLVGYFFHKAQKESEGKEGALPIEEGQYRYPGPKPQFREAALVMIADAAEAASRSLPEPSETALRALVKKMINGIFADGQLDECDLTLKDLNVLADAFSTTLMGIYHTRPEYPPGAQVPPGQAGAPTLRAVGDAPTDVKKLGT